ncbi:MAG: superfamily II DNA or RNA helicase, partial [Sulfurimonas sp.]
MSELIDVIVLNFLEEIEYKSIQWGYIDGALSEDDVYDYVLQLINDNKLATENFVSQHKLDSLDEDDLVKYLLDENLLFEVKTSPSKTGFRTRFGESIRLLANLRQIFPNRGWEEAPRLVSDFRVKLQKRFYPIRDVNPLDLLNHEPFSSLSKLQKNVWYKLVTVYPNMKLANFQVKATSTLIESNSQYKGVIVTAGTGSGKTLSFYLPALLQVVDSINNDTSHWTRVLAAYPRIELLRDQLSEAILQSLEIETTLNSNRLRPIRIGALYGSIPDKCSYASIENKKWKRNRENTGWICPIINCPKTDIPLIWLDIDVEAKRERLVPSQNIDGAITLEHEHIALTRESLLNQTPDLLFITLEMLNQRLSDFSMNKLFGINQYNKKPFLMLLDEVHTYTGTTGAQAALVIRRWKQALWNDNLKFVGLSATLSDAARFFSELTGLYENKIIEITPLKNEMIEEGSEYQVVLKGDPVNRTGLLSTTIQTIMLMGRLVEPLSMKSKLYGQKVFAFTDDLDVTNRLFDDLKDAEGWDVFNRNDPEQASLARLRHKSDDYLRYRDGQDWRACENIGHLLDENSADGKLKITRTSSQDTGVDRNSSVVVATASLEVGFNDPTVGVVVQHKAPHNWANFLQRKGRAGRKRGMRPFMVTTLSDFGRDKVAFQHYEQFFEPKVPAQRLPISNRYILKIQGTITLFDWLAKKLPHRKIWMFKLLSKPTKNQYELDTLNEIKSILENILKVKSNEFENFTKYLKYSLSVTDENMKEILWSAPRSLILEVIPTLLRRIESNWKLAFPDGDNIHENYIKNHPLPEYITSTLFSDLALPEVNVIASLDQDREKQHSMSLIQAMREFSPGRISRRFATDRGNLFHWIPIAIDVEEQNLEILDYSSKVDRVKSIKHNDVDIEIFRPWEYKLEKNSNPRISKRSNSMLEWNATFEPNGSPVKIHLAKGNDWSKTIRNLDFYVNTHNASVDVTRFATSAVANFSFTDGSALETKVNFVHNSSLSAIGFSLHADALHIKYKIMSLVSLEKHNLPATLKRELKVAWYKHLVLEDKALPSDINHFERNWLQEVILNAIIIVSNNKDVSLVKANEILNNDSSIIFDVLSDLFNTDIRLLDDTDSDKETTSESRLYERLKELLDAKSIRVILHSVFNNAISVDDIGWWKWVQHSLHKSFAEAVLAACQQLTPNQSAIDTLLVDSLTIKEDSDEADIWLTESSAGGVGVLDSLVNVVGSNPTLLFQAIDAATQSSSYEHVVDSLEYFVNLVNDDEEINTLALQICSVKEHKQRQELLSTLYSVLYKHGLPMSHAFKVAINTRLLRDGVDNNFFNLIKEIMLWRDKLENDKEIAIDLQLLCFLISKEDEFVDKISKLQMSQSSQNVNIVNFLTNILWPRSFEARWQVLQSYSPFNQNKFTDPQLVKSYILEEKIQYININDIDWDKQVSKYLSRYGVCKLIADT